MSFTAKEKNVQNQKNNKHLTLPYKNYLQSTYSFLADRTDRHVCLHGIFQLKLVHRANFGRT